MIGIILLVMESGSSMAMLILEYFCKDSLSISWLVDSLTVALDAHTSSVDCIELILDVVRGSWRSLSTSCGRWMTIIITLCD